jgi:mono/diheme cytochrome c family protein
LLPEQTIEPEAVYGWHALSDSERRGTLASVVAPLPLWRRAIVGVATIGVLLGFTPIARAADTNADAIAFFENQVRPLLVKACAECHGPTRQRASLRLDSREAVLRGGDSGPAAVPGKPRESLIVQAVGDHGPVHMPPKGKLKDEQVAVLTRWVEMGVPFPAGSTTVAVRASGITDADRKFWSFQPIRDPAVPVVHDSAWPATDIDRFILAKLEAKGIKPAALADKRTLIRRATYDLTGLPPTAEEIQSFLHDDSPGAFALVVERLLASPAYGERWGRHWLDVVRYADTAGETADYPAPLAYRYRNRVIDAFNADLPYDVFIREQIAGDLLARNGPREKYAERVTSTGFIAISRRFGYDPENYQHLTIQDTIDTTGQAILGLTLGCARCHDHKFDPVTRADYYALYGIFDSTRYAFPGSEQHQRPYDLVPLIPPSQSEPLEQRHKSALSALTNEVKQLEADLKAKEPRTIDKPLAERRTQLGELQKKQLYEVAYGVRDGKPHDVRIHKRGEPADLGELAPRRFLEILGGDGLLEDAGSGRLELADWLTRPENPLTARVIVNRVWQYHFGVGIVATANDFGARGRPPSHPELLDYLASRFRDEGWSIKNLHRRIMLSRVYQLSSQVEESAAALDPENQLFGRARRQRLDAEELRDTLLMLSGRLDRTPGGPHPFPPQDSWHYSQHSPFAAVYPSNHRSVYLMSQRLRRHPFLALFDGADTNASTPQRTLTTVPTQALFLMNDPFVHEQSVGFASRMLAAKPGETERVTLAFQMAVGRPPTSAEVSETTEFLDRYRRQLQNEKSNAESAEMLTWAALARTLFARNEFAFVD